MTGQQHQAASSTVHLISGALAGALQTVIWHPLDLLKTRMQVQDARIRGGGMPAYNSLTDAIRSIVRLEGSLGFLRGVWPSVLGSSLAWGIQMPLYKTLKELFGENSVGLKVERTFFYWAPRDLACSWAAGCLTNIVVHPVYLVKTRMQLQPRTRGGGAVSTDIAKPVYQSSTHAIASIVREEGIAGLYSGFLPSLLLSTHGAVLLASYDHFKALCSSVVVASFCAKVFATTVTYPLQVLRSVMQQRPAEHERFPYTSLKVTATILWQRGGIGAFYRGIGPQMMRTVPQSVAFFSIYEQLLGVFVRLLSQEK